MPDRVLRQFGYRQGVPEDPPAPREVKRRVDLRAYDLQYADELCTWDADPRPTIELQDMIHTTFAWDTDDAYIDWLEQMSHPYVDARSPRQDRPGLAPVVPPTPPVSTLMV